MSYTPEFYCGFTGWNEQLQPTYGLVPWPEHLQPRPEPALKLTKKGEAYCALVEAQEGVVINLTAADRAAIEEAIERLIALLDAMEPDADAEPSLGWADSCHLGGCDDREDECEDEGAQCDDEGAIDYDPPGFIWGGGEDGREVRP